GVRTSRTSSFGSESSSACASLGERCFQLMMPPSRGMSRRAEEPRAKAWATRGAIGATPGMGSLRLAAFVVVPVLLIGAGGFAWRKMSSTAGDGDEPMVGRRDADEGGAQARPVVASDGPGGGQVLSGGQGPRGGQGTEVAGAGGNERGKA